MTFVKLIEEVYQIKNHIEIVATVKPEDGKEYLGITEFNLQSGQLLPEDEDELAYFLEDLDLTWDLYIPNYDNVLIAA